MGFIDFMNHLLNFVAPALAVGLMLAICALWLGAKYSPRWSWVRQTGANTAVGVLVLVLGLLFFGRDGKMATYAAMVLACAACQMLLGWRKNH